MLFIEPHAKELTALNPGDIIFKAPGTTDVVGDIGFAVIDNIRPAVNVGCLCNRACRGIIKLEKALTVVTFFSLSNNCLDWFTYCTNPNCSEGRVTYCVIKYKKGGIE